MFHFLKNIKYRHSYKGGLLNFRALNLFYIRVYLIFLSIINTLEWLLARFIFSEIDQDRIALHYNVDFGIDNYGETEKIFFIPLIGLSIIVVNLFLYMIITKREDKVFVSHILFLTSLFSNCILLVSIALIYLVNFS
jgi:hypothetical protein